MPESHANVRFYYEQKLRDAQVGGGGQSTVPLAIGNGQASQELVQFARHVLCFLSFCLFCCLPFFFLKKKPKGQC